jgi:FtsP/CotA-like multicopper oxidase with cupredoxin domain
VLQQSKSEEDAMAHIEVSRHHVRRGLCAASAGALACLLQALPAQAQAPAAPAQPAQAQPVQPPSCDPLIGKRLIKVPEIVSNKGVLKGTILLSDQQVLMGFRTPPQSEPGQTGTFQVCQPQYVRYFSGLNAAPALPPTPADQYPLPVPGPTLRAKVGDVVELTFLNQINPGNFGNSIDRAENGIGGGCDQSSGGFTIDNTGARVPRQGYPTSVGDVFPDCFHGSSTGNIHFHGTHTNPNGTGDNVLIEVRPSPRANNQPTITEDTFKNQFDKFFAECEQRLKANILLEWPLSWNDAPLGPPSDPNTYTGMQQQLLQAYDNGRPPSQQLWPTDKSQYDQGLWPQYYIGAYPYCFRLPEYTSRIWPPEPSAVHAGMQMGPVEPAASLHMGQSPGIHWYHAHKHGSTAINVANGMTGAFIIEGKYDEDINATYGEGWTSTQPVMVINQLGVTPNLLRVGPGRTDKGPDFSVNGQLQPRVKMYPGEVQMWRIVNTSGRSGAYFAGPPRAVVPTQDPPPPIDPTKDVQWMQLAQDGVQFAERNYQGSLNEGLLMASGNRVDLLVKAPTKPTKQTYDVLVQPAVSAQDLAATPPPPTVALVTIEIEGSGPEMQFLRHAPIPPPYLADITDDEITGTKSVVFTSLGPGKAFQHTINGQPFNGEVGEVMLLNTAEEWTIRNATAGPPIDHPFHIHINPFQVTEVFDPNETIIDPATKKAVNKYVFDPADKALAAQCVLDPNDPDTWKPCVKNREPYRVWWDVFPIPTGRQISVFGRNVVVPGHFKMRSRFVDYPGLFVIHCHILAHEDRGMMMVVEVRPLKLPFAH